MPRYFFHIDEKRHHIDTEGVDLSDIDAAKSEALKIVGTSMIENTAGDIWSCGEWMMTVADENARELFVIRLSASSRTDAGSS